MKEKKVLDKGHVKLLNLEGPWDGTTRDIARSARVSFGNENLERTYEQDMKLVKYLYKNKHDTPFEMIQLWFEMKVPIFVARQLMRHRACSYSEISGRYVKLEQDYYVPDDVASVPTDGAKQGRGNGLPADTNAWAKNLIDYVSAEQYETYAKLLDAGVAPEHARMVLPLNMYTRYIVRFDLRNFIHFLTLRNDPHAQYESQLYAKAMHDLVSEVFPELTEIMETER